MIFVAAGTKDGRLLADFLQEAGYAVLASAITEYGSNLLKQNPAIAVNDKRLDLDDLTDFLRNNGATAVVDATHPYAKNVSENAMRAAAALNLPYIRYERPTVDVDYDRAYIADSYEDAAIRAAELGRNIFLTTGSRSLDIFTRIISPERLIVRVLPAPDVIARCFDLGLTPKNIIALQGPFSTEFNENMFRHAKADVIVTKNSGETGGADTKIAAAKNLSLPLVIIGRPKLNYPAVADDFSTVKDFLAGQNNKGSTA